MGQQPAERLPKQPAIYRPDRPVFDLRSDRDCGDSGEFGDLPVRLSEQSIGWRVQRWDDSSGNCQSLCHMWFREYERGVSRKSRRPRRHDARQRRLCVCDQQQLRFRQHLPGYSALADTDRECSTSDHSFVLQSPSSAVVQWSHFLLLKSRIAWPSRVVIQN